MNPPDKKSILTDKRLFTLEQLNGTIRLESFHCQIEEYNEYLFNEAVKSQNDQMALTTKKPTTNVEKQSAYAGIF